MREGWSHAPPLSQPCQWLLWEHRWSLGLSSVRTGIALVVGVGRIIRCVRRLVSAATAVTAQSVDALRA